MVLFRTYEVYLVDLSILWNNPIFLCGVQTNCYDEFENPLFENSRGSIAFNADCSIWDEVATAAAVAYGGVVIFAVCMQICVPICLTVPIIVGLCCICKTCNDRSPIDKKINEAEKQAKQKLE